MDENTALRRMFHTALIVIMYPTMYGTLLTAATKKSFYWSSPMIENVGGLSWDSIFISSLN